MRKIIENEMENTETYEKRKNENAYTSKGTLHEKKNYDIRK